MSTADEITRNLLSGRSYWNPETGDCIFYDEDYDFANGTFCITRIDLDSVTDGDVWTGYCSDSDDYIERHRAIVRMLTEPGWELVRRMEL